MLETEISNIFVNLYYKYKNYIYIKVYYIDSWSNQYNYIYI